MKKVSFAILSILSFTYNIWFVNILISSSFRPAVSLITPATTTSSTRPKCYKISDTKSTLRSGNNGRKQPCSYSTSYRHNSVGSFALPMIEQDNNEPLHEFVNPFERKVTATTKRVPYLVSNTVSLRQMRMRELMSKLLLANTPVEIDDILHKHEELLMEPLIKEDAVLDKDSIYQVGMTVEERFERYNSVMTQREQQAVNDQVKQILGSMREFVMSRSGENSNPTDPK